MNIGKIVSTVQAEPLMEEFLTPEKAKEVMVEANKSLDTYETLVNDEITQDVREDIFAGVGR